MRQTELGQDFFRATDTGIDAVQESSHRLVNPASGSALRPLMLPFIKKPDAGRPATTESVKIIVGTDDWAQLSRVVPDLDSALLALWEILLWRFSNEAEVVVGCLQDARAYILPVTIRFSPELSFAEVVRSIDQIRSHTEEPQNRSRLDDIPLTAGFLAEKDSVNATEPVSDSRGFPILLRVQSQMGSRTLELLYHPACCTRETVERMARSYATIFAAAAADPNATADTLPMLSTRDYEQVVREFNQTVVPYPAKCVHQLFEEQVKRTPHNPALRFRDQIFTYQELNVRANQLAHFLRRRGVGPNVAVGLFVERSAEMIIGLLGILKAGGCYVPLVHDDPQARLSYLLSEARPPVVLATRELLSRLPSYSGEVVPFEEAWQAEPGQDPENKTAPTDLVCVIYTSGSTGVPKGVAARHSNLANYAQFICERLGRPQGWHFATVSTISAILGNTSVFGALMSGGCLHVIDYETAMAPNLFADYIGAHPIDVLKITPSQLSNLLSGAQGRCVLPGKYLVIGGEKFTWELLEQIRQNGSCKVMNHYGPTETMGCCTFIVDGYDFSQWKPASVPLGRPMSNQRLYIVDRLLRPVPVGVPGELCMSGAGLTQGYFNQPQQTAEKFVANPFPEDPCPRLYRTGDLARFLPDGNIEFLGRIDHQVKIRGFRVEPAEVEAVLKWHPDVKQVVIVPEESASGEKRLAAYIVPARPLDGAELRTFLRQQFPEYMVPSRLILLECLPLNRNGKIDLPALAALKEEAPAKECEVIGPSNPVEEQLADIWKALLKQERIGIHDNFFMLGGHSLLASQVIARIRNTFRVQVPLIDFLESPTIAALAEKISQLPRAETEEEETERFLRELEGMSDAEAESLLPAEVEGDPAAGGGAPK